MRQIEGKPVVNADFFGKYTFINLLRKNTRSDDEVFFSIQRRDAVGQYVPTEEYGYIRKTKEMEDFIKNNFFTGCSSVQFIQWLDCWNVVFDESSIIGGISFRMSFEEFDKLFPTKADTIRKIEDEFSKARNENESFEGTMSYMIDCLINRSFDEWNWLSDRLWQLRENDINSLLKKYGDDEHFVCKNGKLVEVA